MRNTTNIWNYPDTWLERNDVVGYDVEATDGRIGTIDEASYETDTSHIVVDTGFWIFGKKRLIPAGAVTRIDPATQTITVNLTKEQIKNAPDYEEQRWDPTVDRARYDEYYGPYGW